jgi:hypothetical protein
MRRGRSNLGQMYALETRAPSGLFIALLAAHILRAARVCDPLQPGFRLAFADRGLGTAVGQWQVRNLLVPLHV